MLKTLSKTNRVDKENFYKRIKRNRQLLYMLLITNLYFLLALLPCCIIFVLLSFKHVKHHETVVVFDEDEKEKNILYTVRIQYAAHILSYTNYSVSIAFYMIWSQKFREEFVQIFCKRKRQQQNTFRRKENEQNMELKEND
jgi:D-alanyl-lipoteichoic acid acyltransferase DltB (MBOAT superfamily)